MVTNWRNLQSGTMFNFALVFPDKRGNYHFKEVGTTSVAHTGPDDRVTLLAVRCVVQITVGKNALVVVRIVFSGSKLK